ncbi:MAG: HAMP domain-containing histidine kinase [Ferruginibacter sp.]|nr:HAMP domain-containing histidine kinase [Ferruginibacter sp.]
MLSIKNISPKKVSALSALLIAIPLGITLFFLNTVWWVALLISTVFGLGSFGIIYFFFQHFIYRQIKLIFKLISQTKATKREEFYYQELLPKKSIEDVQAEVEQWAIQKREEIEILKQNEHFRKEFLQNLSHELKTPIFAIQGYTETLLNGAVNNPDVNLRFLQNSSRNIDRLVNLLNDLDEISKLESGSITLSLSSFQMQELVRDVFESLEIKIRKKNIHAFIKKGCEIPKSVVADKEKIRQVLINIIDNAIKYGRENGIIEAGLYTVDDKLVLIEITDDGYGISPDYISRIFERFFRADQTRSRGVGGSGLGLSICKHIIEAHGQSIQVRSKPDIGTTIGFSLPLK